MPNGKTLSFFKKEASFIEMYEFFKSDETLLIQELEGDAIKRISLIDAIFTNGFTMFFVLISLTVGVSLPMLLLKKNTVKKLDS